LKPEIQKAAVLMYFEEKVCYVFIAVRHALQTLYLVVDAFGEIQPTLVEISCLLLNETIGTMFMLK